MAETLVTDALGTVERVAEFLSITPTAEQEDVIIRMINGVTAAIQRYCGRNMRSRVYTPATTPDDSIFDGSGYVYLYLPNYPVTLVSELEIGLVKYPEILRRSILAVSATAFSSVGFTFDSQDAELNRGVISISPNVSTETTQAVIAFVSGAVATLTPAGWSNGTPALPTTWWFARGFHRKRVVGILTLSDSIFSQDNMNVRASYTAGYADSDPELDQLFSLTTSLVSYLFKKSSHVGYKSETMGAYSYTLDSPQFNDFWNMHDIGALNQFINMRAFL